MLYIFEDTDLADLIVRHKSRNKLYKKLSSNATFMHDLEKTMTIIRSVSNASKLYDFGSLNYEELKYNLKGCHSIQIGFKTKYRLIVKEIDNKLCLKLIEISEHYGDK